MTVTRETPSEDKMIASILNDTVRREPAGEQNQARRVGPTADLEAEWQNAVREARVPDAFTPLDADLE